MFRRMICLLCLLVLLCSTAQAASQKQLHSYNFDLSLSLNAESFPLSSRARARGYAELVNRLGVKGNLTWYEKQQSFDLNAALFFTDKPDVSLDLRLYGTPERVFATSSLLGNQTVMFNMSALLEFAVKTKNTLGVPLPYLALLYPYTTEYALRGLSDAWTEVVGTLSGSGKVTRDQLEEISTRWDNVLNEDAYLNIYRSALAEGSSAPQAVDEEFANLPYYLTEYVAKGKALRYQIKRKTETWKTSDKTVLYSRKKSGDSLEWAIRLPATENRYLPSASFSSLLKDGKLDFSFAASYLREEEQEDETYPANLLSLSAEGTALPEQLPAQSDFSLSLSLLGAVMPYYSFQIQGNTKEDGAVSVSFCKPFSEDKEPVPILSVGGSLQAVEAASVPRFSKKLVDQSFNLFSFNENRLASFEAAIIRPLVKGVLRFVAEAPAVACQSFLDDLNDMGLLDVLLAQ